MGCLICGKLPVSEETLNQIANIKVKKQTLDEKINTVFTSDPNNALNLIIKTKKYEKELKQLETYSFASKQLLCKVCYENIKQSMKEKILNEKSDNVKINEFLKIIKIHNFMIKEIVSEYFNRFDHPIKESMPGNEVECPKDLFFLHHEVIEFTEDLLKKYNDTIESIQKRIIDCDYYEAYLCYILGYYNEALVLFEKTLKNLDEDNIIGIDSMLNDLGEVFEDYDKGKNKLKNIIQEYISKIKIQLGLNN
ncbi:MAG: hypothetical protein FWD87_10400 [Spirochaetaceae bacterium]|nr:hypothetical protein [Spirochaetaceae bacterium]